MRVEMLAKGRESAMEPVEVLETKRLDIYTVSVLRATDPDKLYHWVSSNRDEGASVVAEPPGLEAAADQAAKGRLAVGEQGEVGGQDEAEELEAVAAAIKDHRDAALAHQGAHLLQDARQHLDQAGVGLGGEDQQGIAQPVVDPVIGGGWQGQAHPRHVGLGQWVLAVIDPHVAVHVEQAQQGAARRDPLLRQRLAQLRRAPGGGQLRQFAPQRFDFGRAVQTQHPAQVLGGVFLETFGPFDPQQRHE